MAEKPTEPNNMAQATDEIADMYEKELGVKVIGMELVDPETLAVLVEKDGQQGYFVTPIANPEVPSEVFQDTEQPEQSQMPQQPGQPQLPGQLPQQNQAPQRRKPGTPIGGGQV